jgi:outer membrane protein TolC
VSLHFDEETNMKRRIIALGALAWVLTGCASFSRDGGVEAVEALARPRLKQDIPRATAEAIRGRLSRPIEEHDAVALALMNNPALQAAYAELGIAEADLVQAGRMRNPGISFARFHRGEEREIERKLVLDLIGLVTMPWRLEAARASFSAAQMRAAREIVRLADEARRAWIGAVAAEEGVRYAEHVKDAAQASADLAREMTRAGNFSRLTEAREQLFLVEAQAQLARSQHAARAARERLVRAMGLTGEQLGFRLPERLPDPPATPRELGDAESVAMQTRLDVQAARDDAEMLARSLGLTRATRFVNVLHFGLERDASNELPRRTGYEVELELPIFDSGNARLSRAEAMHRQAVARTAGIAVRARSEVREAHSAYRAAYDVAKRYREEVMPLRKRISEENLLRYNGMLISVFELLADAREQAVAVRSSMEAGRDFWIAEANLETAISTGSPATFELKASTLPATAADTAH